MTTPALLVTRPGALRVPEPRPVAEDLLVQAADLRPVLGLRGPADTSTTVLRSLRLVAA